MPLHLSADRIAKYGQFRPLGFGAVLASAHYATLLTFRRSFESDQAIPPDSVGDTFLLVGSLFTIITESVVKQRCAVNMRKFCAFVHVPGRWGFLKLLLW